MKKVLWIDTETTGLHPKKNGLREIAFILNIDGITVYQEEFFIDPRTYNKSIEIDPKALELSGKTIEDLDEYYDSRRVFATVKSIFDEFVDKDDKDDYFILAGYNVKFDNNFLKAWFEDNGAGEEWNKYIHYKVLDVFPLVITLKHLGLIETKNDKLKTVCEYFDIALEEHNAMEDIQATYNLYKTITDRFIRKS